MNNNLEIEMKLYVVKDMCNYAFDQMVKNSGFVNNMTKRVWIQNQIQQAKEIVENNFPKSATEFFGNPESLYNASSEINFLFSKNEELFQDESASSTHDTDRIEAMKWCLDTIGYASIYLTSLTPE